MRFDGVTLWRSCLRGFLGELGDKTFFLTVIFAAWCPWGGLRSGSDRSFQLFLVFGGATVALASRVAFPAHDAAVEPPLRSAFDGVVAVALLLLATKARVELNHAEVSAKRRHGLLWSTPQGGGASSRNPFEESAEEIKASHVCDWNPQAFARPAEPSPAAPPLPEEAAVGKAQATVAAYGAMLLPPTSADGVFSERISDDHVSSVLAFLAPLVLNFLAEAEDKSRDALLPPQFDPSAGCALLGAALGLAVAVMLAVFVGYILECQLSDRRALFSVASALLVLSLISISQALLHLSAARPLALRRHHGGEVPMGGNINTTAIEQQGPL
mmetsp:Transcript_19997/g.42702  ORF Transcript_19997/g.42702 Transcript_19997/m.42702 type:complete len:328 (-) Transcript_19997:68-1051(-)